VRLKEGGKDWSATAFNAAPLQQGECESSWAFSAANAMESAMAIKEQRDVKPISVQHLIDCDTYNNGCNKGQQYNSFTYMKEQGFVYWQDYYQKSYLAR
jgi:C1A family cysteine protease